MEAGLELEVVVVVLVVIQEAVVVVVEDVLEDVVEAVVFLRPMQLWRVLPQIVVLRLMLGSSPLP